MIFLKEKKISQFSARKTSSDFTAQGRELSELLPATLEYFFTALRHFGLNRFTLYHIAFLPLWTYYGMATSSGLRYFTCSGHFSSGSSPTFSTDQIIRIHLTSLQKSRKGLTTPSPPPCEFPQLQQRNKYATAGKSLISNWFARILLLIPCTETKCFHSRTAEVFFIFFFFLIKIAKLNILNFKITSEPLFSTQRNFMPLRVVSSACFWVMGRLGRITSPRSKRNGCCATFLK